MSKETSVDVDALGQVTDQTFGRSSTVKSATFSAKAKMVSEDRLQLDYICIVTYVAGEPMHGVMKKYDAEAESALAETLKKVKSEYKELTGSALKTKLIGDKLSSIEPVTYSSFSPVRRGYYRCRMVYELS